MYGAQRGICLNADTGGQFLVLCLCVRYKGQQKVETSNTLTLVLVSQSYLIGFSLSFHILQLTSYVYFCVAIRPNNPSICAYTTLAIMHNIPLLAVSRMSTIGDWHRL